MTTAEGFDWFLGILFLLFEGDEQRIWNLLRDYAEDKQAMYLWPALAVVS